MTIREIRSWYRARPGYWFRPKLFGFGAVPVTWQGWALVLGLIAVSLPIAYLIEQRGEAFVVLIAPLIAIFAWIAWAKTDGNWRWRWGMGDKE